MKYIWLILLLIPMGLWAQTITPIADIQEDESSYDGQTVTVEGIVTMGASVLNASHLNVYIQDESGKGIMLYRSTINSTDTAQLVRGNKVQVTGTVDEYNGTTEIAGSLSYEVIESGLSIDSLIQDFTISQAQDYATWEGTIVRISGSVYDDSYTSGGGTNVYLQDAQNNQIIVRVWTSTGITADYTVGDELTVVGVVDDYNSSSEIMPGYAADIQSSGSGVPEIGTITWTPESPSADQIITVSATITDSDGSIEEQFLEYHLASQSTWLSVDMQQQGSTNTYTGHLPKLSDLTPDEDNYVVRVRAVDDDENEVVSPEQTITVTGGSSGDYVRIADIQNNLSTYEGQTVKVLAAVTIGAGKLRTDMMTAYVQDTSGAGIELFAYDITDAYTNDIVRGNVLEITGTVDDYNGVTELTDFTYTVKHTDVDMTPYTVSTSIPAILPTNEGCFVSFAANIVDIGTAGTGTNITVADGAGNEIGLRIWDTTGIDTSIYGTGDPVLVHGVISTYNSAAQLLPAYQEDILNLDNPIAQITWTPTMPFAADSITVSARIEYTSDIVSAHLKYALAKVGSYTSIPMTAVGNHIYQAVLPPLNSLTQVEDNFLVKIEATDAAGDNLTSDVVTITVNTGKPVIDSYTYSSTSMLMYSYVKSPFLDEAINIEATILDYNGTIDSARVEYGLASAREPHLKAALTAFGSNVWRVALPALDTLTQADDDLIFRLVATDNEGNVTRTPLVTVVVAPRAPIVYGITQENTPALGEALQVSANIFDTNGTILTASLHYTLDYDDHVYSVAMERDSTSATPYRYVGTLPVYGSGRTLNVSVYAEDDEGLSSEQYPANADEVVSFTYPVVAHKAVLKVPPHPFNPYEGETLPIDFYGKKGDHAVLRIYNAEGKMVLTAENLYISTDDGLGRFNWNGRNRLNSLQPLGLYICHLEVTNAQTGKKMTDQAPIVIGDWLK